MLPSRYDDGAGYGTEGYVDPYLAGSGDAGGDRYGIGAVVYADADDAYRALLDDASPYAYAGSTARYGGGSADGSYDGESYEDGYQTVPWLEEFGIDPAAVVWTGGSVWRYN
jgi:hypothetical protein